MKPTRSVRIGRICKKHPDENGLRYVGNSRCVECAKEESRRHYANLELTPAQKITTLLAEISKLKAENAALRMGDDRLQSAKDLVQTLCDSAGKQPSVATGYLHDILSALSNGDQS